MIQNVLLVIMVILSAMYTGWIIILLLPEKKSNRRYAPKISIILPAYNEEKIIEKSVMSIIDTKYPNDREIIVVNDGSKDNTGKIVSKIAKKYAYVKLLNLNHVGKAGGINEAVKISKYGVIVTLDADSVVDENSLIKIVQPLSDKDVGGVAGIIRARRNSNILTWFQDFEYILSSGWRLVCTKVNANSFLPGFAALKKNVLLKINGYSSDTLTEDVDIVLQMKKAGYRTVSVSDAVMYTEVPQTLISFIKQRIRWGRGNLQVMKKNFKFLISRKSENLGRFSFPTHLYWYIHAIIYVPIMLMMMFGDYIKYFLLKNNIISLDVARYFFSWFSLFGMLETTGRIAIGYYQLNISLIMTVIIFSLSTIYNFILFFKLTKPDLKHFIAFFFFFPYMIFNLSLWAISFFLEIFSRKSYNRWEK